MTCTFTLLCAFVYVYALNYIVQGTNTHSQKCLCACMLSCACALGAVGMRNGMKRRRAKEAGRGCRQLICNKPRSNRAKFLKCVLMDEMNKTCVLVSRVYVCVEYGFDDT